MGASQDDDAGSDSGSAYVFVSCLVLGCDLTIVQPPDGAVFNSGTSITFEAAATDPEDGDISETTVWTSNIQEGSATGALGDAHS